MATTEHAPEDPAQVRDEIERTRQQLGETVERLAAKADVKSRARAEAGALAGRVAHTWSSVAGSARQTAGKAARAARPYRVPLSAAVVVLVAAALAARKRGKR